MNVTFLIGNGFDLQVGLRTRYIDFYKVYIVPNEKDSPAILKFKEQILKDEAHGWRNWSDFELGMAQQSIYIKRSKDIFASYFKSHDTKSGVNRFGESWHVHGRIDDHPILGVSEAEQIQNEEIRNSQVQRIFVKENYINSLQSQDVNEIIPATRAIKTIERSRVICIYGASMGEADKHWWEKIGKWLERGGMLVIFDICGSKDDGVSPLLSLSSWKITESRRQDIIARFLKLAEIDENWYNSNKIVVEFDTKMFSFKLPRKSAG